MKLVLVLVLTACGSAPVVRPTPPAPPSKLAPPTIAPPPTTQKISGVVITDACTGLKASAEAAALQQKACDGGDGQGCSDLARRYICASGVPLDLPRSTALSERACDLGFVPACGNVAMMVAYPGSNVEPAAAFRYADKGCKAGDGGACNALGLIYLQGIGTPVDAEKSARLFDDQCKRANQQACGNLAMQLYFGMGLARDIPRAAVLAEHACTSVPGACSTLGAILVEQGGDANMQRAEILFASTCNLGNGGACDNLGQLYARGVGQAPPDRDRASAAYKQACDLGFAKACTHLAELISQ